MQETQELSGRLTELLGLELQPVGVKLFDADLTPPEEARAFELEKPLKSYCQALTRAARGSMIYGSREYLGCVLGTSTLGLEPDPEGPLDDSVLEKYGVGLFESEEASRNSVMGAPKFAAGAHQAVLIGPLDRMPVEPQIVILEVDPETAMWLMYASNYTKGGVQPLPQSGGVAGGCADVTAVVLFGGEVNVTFLGLGCRLKSGIPREHILLGLPYERLGEVVDNLEKMAKPIAMLSDSHP